MSFFERYKQYARGKLRVWGSWLALFVLAFYIDQNPSIDGILLIATGAFIRFYASGYIDKEGKLSTKGIYALTRNPLYLGSFLIALGAAVSQHNAVLILLFCLLNFAIYYPLILAEEDILKEKFHGPYEIYKKIVPRFFPWTLGIKKLPTNFLESDPRLNKTNFSWEKIKENKGYEGFATAAGVIFFIYTVIYIKKFL